MLPCRLEKRACCLDPTQIDRLVAVRAQPGHGRRSGPKLRAGTQGESPAEGKLVGVQSERYQQRPSRRIRLTRIAPQADSPKLGKRHRRALRHPRKGDRRRRGVVPHERHLPVADFGELVALRARNPPTLAHLPCRAVVGIGRYDVVGVQIEGKRPRHGNHARPPRGDQGGPSRHRGGVARSAWRSAGCSATRNHYAVRI